MLYGMKWADYSMVSYDLIFSVGVFQAGYSNAAQYGDSILLLQNTEIRLWNKSQYCHGRGSGDGVRGVTDPLLSTQPQNKVI